VIIGIDPGMTGALAVLDRGQLVAIMPMPTTAGQVSGMEIAAILESYEPTRVCIEDVHAMPQNGSISSFKLGYNFGVVMGVINAAHIPIMRVTPHRWKKSYNLIGKDKSASRALAMELYPAHAHAFRLRKDDGKAEATLIARWGLGEYIRQANAEESLL
jgi:crossover junction endodeoxyribonuclease RuvC